MKSQGHLFNRLMLSIALFFLYSAIALASSGEGAAGSWDYIPPTAVCDDRVNVSLNSAGIATVYAQTFDEGSYDNYCLAGVKVRRTGQPNQPFANAITFNCSDIGPLISVELQARDCAGNTNSCWSEVRVEDKIAPYIQCPYNKTIPCGQLNNWGAMGQATATDNCGLANITFTDTDNTGSCGAGYIFRAWKATDIYGNMSSCTQTIHIIDTTPVVVLFPPDTTFHDCITADDLDPEDLPAPYNEPRVLYDDCEIMAFNYQDWVFTAASNSCLKILRRWKVIDWCTYQYGGNEGIWEDTQILKIQDNTPPAITCPDDIVKAVGGNCTATVNMPPLAAIDDCLADIDVRIMGGLGQGTTFTNVPPGVYEMTYIAKDGCLNTSSCTITVSVVDATPPGVVCLHGVSFPLMANGEGMLWASDLEWGSNSADNCTPYENLEFRLGREPAPGQTTPPDEDFLTFTCADTGTNVVALWVGDEAGNWDYCLTTAIVQDNQNACGPGPMLTQARIAGLVTDEQGDEVPGVMVYIDSTASGAYMAATDSLGRYAFDNMPTGAAYALRPEKEGQSRDGLSNIDLILLAMHVMGYDTLETPYQYIAADLDRSGTVDMDDFNRLNRVLLGLDTEFPDSINWRFVPKAFIFPAENPLDTVFPEELVIGSLSQNRDDADFIAIKLGDLDASLIAPADSILGRSAFSPFVMQAQDQYLHAGESVEVCLEAQTADAAVGLFLNLEHAGLALEEAYFDELKGAVAYRGGAGRSAVSWAAGKTFGFKPGQAMITLRFKAERAGLLSEVLSLGKGTQAFRTAAGIEAGPAELRFVPVEDGLRLASAFPNPFREKAFLRIAVPRPGRVSLSAWDSRGALVYQTEWTLDAGRHDLAIDAASLGEPGAYFFRLQSASGEASGRLVLAPGR
ncbi:MAG: HYR domain-containing protein [Phaeodactylibacter sp.]|nr:HYR domain-containing protein [Phaeodactylibacter sp.]